RLILHLSRWIRFSYMQSSSQSSYYTVSSISLLYVFKLTNTFCQKIKNHIHFLCKSQHHHFTNIKTKKDLSTNKKNSYVICIILYHKPTTSYSNLRNNNSI